MFLCFDTVCRIIYQGWPCLPPNHPQGRTRLLLKVSRTPDAFPSLSCSKLISTLFARLPPGNSRAVCIWRVKNLRVSKVNFSTFIKMSKWQNLKAMMSDIFMAHHALHIGLQIEKITRNNSTLNGRIRMLSTVMRKRFRLLNSFAGLNILNNKFSR
jgi:hypothetical protein